MNSVKLIGNVGKEVIVKEFGKGQKLASFSLATSESYTNKNNEQVTNTLWHRIVVFGKLAQFCEDALGKGEYISIEGKLQYRCYQNKEQKTSYITEIIANKIEEVQSK